MNYLERHPEAQDTVEGIRDWWLTSKSSMNTKPEHVQKALQHLVARQLVTGRLGVDGQTHYRSNCERPTSHSGAAHAKRTLPSGSRGAKSILALDI